MATLALAAVGAAVGGYIAPGVVAFGMTGASIGWTVGAVAGNMLFAPRTRQSGPRLADLSTTSSTYGVSLPTVWGTAKIAGNIIWSLPLNEQASTTRTGKGGGGSYYTTYTYTGTFAVAICEGEVTEITRIWANGKLIYDIRIDADASMVGPSTDLAAVMTVYKGDETQLPSEVIERTEGVGNVPAYRGVAYVVFDDLPLADYGNALPNLEFEVIVDGTSEVPVLIREYANVDGDLMPATSARLIGDTILLGHTSDAETPDYLSQLRTVVNADADEELVPPFALTARLPQDYVAANYQSFQIRNDPYVRVTNVYQEDEDGDMIASTQRAYFHYLDSYGQITGFLSNLWSNGTPGPYVSLTINDYKYIYQAPIPYGSELNRDILLARLRMPMTEDEAESPAVQILYVPDGMVYNGNGINDHVGTPNIAADEELRRIVIGG